MKKTNPYNFKLPVQEDMFYGRVEERDNIVRNLLKFPGDSVAIVGGRRIGKTCLLEAIRRSLENLLSFEQVDLIPIPIFIKLSGEIPSSSHALFSHIGNETQLILGRWLGQDFLKFTDISQVTEPAPIIRHFLIEWSELLSKHIERRFRLILLLDECEQIVKQTWATEIYSGLYYLLSDEATNSLFKVVMAGSHHFYTQVQQNGSHLKDILDYHTLNTFDLDATKSLINIPTGAALSEELIKLIVSASGGHPYLIQYVMQNLWDLDLSNITLAKVNQIISEFPRKRNNFMDWVNDLSEESLEIFHIVSMEENGLSEKEVRANFAKPSPNLLHALDALFYHGIITLDDHGNYKVAGQMFHDWFKANISSRFQKSHSNNVQREEMKMEEELFDVFLSHSHSDADAIEMLAKRLEDTEGLKVWLDKWTLIPGESWIHEMARGISQARACAVFLGENTPSGWFRQEIERALNRHAGESTFRVIPVLLPGADKGIVDNFLELRTWVDFQNGIDDKNAFRRLVAGIRRIAPGRDL